MAQFQVDSEQISAANLNIQNTITKLQTEVDALHAQLTSLQTSWTGMASSGFQDMLGRWRATAGAVDAQLNEIGAALATAARQYSEIETANLRLFG